MTKPVAGTPFVPVGPGRLRTLKREPQVQQVVFTTNAAADQGSAEKAAAQLLDRAVRHLDKVDVGALVSAYMDDLGRELDPDRLPPDLAAEEILRITALVETTLDQAKIVLRNRLAIDLTMLIPRLKETTSA